MNERIILDADDQWNGMAEKLAWTIKPPFLTCEPVLMEACFLLQRMPLAIERIRAWWQPGTWKLRSTWTDIASVYSP